jgi:hypothetical protein
MQLPQNMPAAPAVMLTIRMGTGSEGPRVRNGHTGIVGATAAGGVRRAMPPVRRTTNPTTSTLGVD